MSLLCAGKVIHLVKTVTTRSGGIVATYKLRKDASVSVLVLKNLPSPAQLKAACKALGIEDAP